VGEGEKGYGLLIVERRDMDNIDAMAQTRS
jgi:hypothetical protein